MKIALNYGARSDQGRVRSSNQDSAYAGPHLLVLADGMGGPAGGDIASTVTVHELRKLDDDSFLATDMGDQLVHAINAAHEHIVSSSRNDSSLEGLGTTCTALIRSGDTFCLAHIGDSRAYRMRGGALEQMTTDHSFVQYLIQQGQLTPQQAATHPQRSVLLRVLGDTQGRVEVDRATSLPEVGDRWLLCSDGLSGVVDHSQLHAILSRYADPDTACEKLIEAALAGGGPDNITCIVADVVDEDRTPNLPTAPITVGAAALADEHGTRTPITPDLPTAEIPTDDASAALEDDTRPLATTTSTTHPTHKDPAQPQAPSNEFVRRSRKRGIVALGITIVILALLAFGGYRGLAHMRTGWTLTLEDDQVVLYEGTPGTIGPLTLYTHRTVLDDYTVVASTSDCDKISSSHDASLFVDPTASRVLTCAAARTLAPSLDQRSAEAATQWLKRNSTEITVNTTEVGSQPTPPSAEPSESEAAATEASH
ncbi:serine/threonine-protein phosphatase [Nanchangia anserum]|uniref:Serine/threonine-protein phosphatase n=1 Tax=Nanchangia anserum TaxID=2692125 RepID=A0A8I0KRW1_9ACTO|nr:PP2C family serine/threonine-protein phosphatase [Nanchangia anserum]MBD3689797.1 serine/threonine-protein phosphatase [Nanchangia anserum]QOX81970.1 serine/threonine-protein phosphatase [Nanchangia anserum]